MKTLETLDQIRASLGSKIVDVKEYMGEITLEVTKGKLKDVLLTLKNSPIHGYQVLMDLTGVDYLLPVKRTKIVYLLHNPLNYSRLRVILYAARDEQIPTVTDIWAGAKWYERELFDLFGVRFEGHIDLKRILMPDDWPGHPLRRDYALTEESVQFKHGVKPKVPSEIIPHVQSHKRT